jgi:hypothetical protein
LKKLKKLKVGTLIGVMGYDGEVEGGRLKKLKVGTLIGVMGYNGGVGGGRLKVGDVEAW